MELKRTWIEHQHAVSCTVRSQRGVFTAHGQILSKQEEEEQTDDGRIEKLGIIFTLSYYTELKLK